MLGERIAAQSEVMRAIVSDYSPCCGGRAPIVRSENMVWFVAADAAAQREGASLAQAQSSIAAERARRPYSHSNVAAMQNSASGSTASTGSGYSSALAIAARSGTSSDGYSWNHAALCTSSRAGSADRFPTPGRLAVGETIILLHPPLPLAVVSMGMKRERQQNDSLANG